MHECSECGRFAFAEPTVCYWCRWPERIEDHPFAERCVIVPQKRVVSKGKRGLG